MHAFRDALSEEEYEEMKKETVEELKEISETLDKMSGGAVSTLDSNSKEKQVSWALSIHSFIHMTMRIDRRFYSRITLSDDSWSNSSGFSIYPL